MREDITMINNARWSLLLLFFVTCISSALAQQKLTFRIADFSYDAFDQTARDERFKKIDGSGSPYAIVKVCSDNSDDDLRDYRFNFGNMNHIVEDHDGELWLYVQKSAKIVTISRSGYTTINRYDLNTTIESGKVYRMTLSAQGPVIYTQMVMFTIIPADSKAIITVAREGGEQRCEAIGMIDDTGKAAKNLEYGTYTYEVISENYHTSEGRFTLDNQEETHIEKVALRPITGTLFLNSRPLGANIKIDGKNYGTTPCNIHDLLIGHHSIIVFKDGYATKREECDIRGNEQLSLELTLEKTADKTFTVGGATFTMKRVAGGTFAMGATPEQGSDADKDEKPVHQVTLSDYYIGETEVTQELWQAVMGTTVTQQRDKRNTSLPLAGVGNNLPMYYVSWNECQEFIKKLNEMTGQTFHLPTEAEWEYAARGGQNSKGYKYSGSNNLDDVAWYLRNSGDKYLSEDSYNYKDFYNCNTHPVAQKQANELGLYDMSGNVWEWCQDIRGRYNSNAQTNPAGPNTGTEYGRMVRGGSWYENPWVCRVSKRRSYSQGGEYSRSWDRGFRLAL